MLGWDDSHGRRLQGYNPFGVSPVPQTYRFGAFEFDGKTGELRKDGSLLKLQPQPARLLELLVSQAGNVVGRDQIHQAIWGSEIQVDYELGVNRCIRQIRSALHDRSESPVYVKTVPRIGYRFIAPVHTTQSSVANGVKPNPTDTSEEAPMPANRRSWTRLRIFSLAVLASVLLGIAALITWTHYRRQSHLQSNLQVVPLASYLGFQYSPSFSPDGQQVAFTWNGERLNNFDIYLKLIGSSRLLRLTSNSANDYSPAWSPDGRWIAFCRGTELPNSEVWLVSALGGQERKLGELHIVADPSNRPISWSPNGKWLVFAGAEAPGRSNALFLLEISTGETLRLTNPSHREDDAFPAFSPEGDQIAFTRSTGKGFSALYLLPFEPDIRKTLMPKQLELAGFKDVAYGHSAWTVKDPQIVFESSRGGPHQLWIAPAKQNATATPLLSLGTNLSGAAPSQTGRLAFAQSSFTSNVWQIDVEALLAGQPAAARRTVASTRDDESPAVSPGGQKLAFASDRSGFTEVWVSDIDGSDPTQLTFLEHLAGSPSWSPDGKSILFDSRSEGNAHLFSISASGGPPAKISAEAGVLPLASQDGKWIYYSSRSSASEMQIWRLPLPTGSPEQVTKLGGFGVKLSPDGRFAYYTRTNASLSSLWQLDLLSRREIIIAPWIFLRSFVPTNQGVYFFSGNQYEPRWLNYFDLKSGLHQRLYNAGMIDSRGVSLSSDGRTLFFGHNDQSHSELMLAENFWK